jgi:rare lipoprotein A
MATAAACRLRSLAAIALFVLILAGCASGSGRGTAGGVRTYLVGSPYEENGVWYYPRVDYNYDRTGIASWYGPDFDGKYTANGEIYDMNQLTAAHTTLPLPSIVQVTDLQNGRSLQLRVNDRGPFVGGRLIDVSRRAAQLLGFETQGTAPVRVKILREESIAAAVEATRNSEDIMAAAASVPFAVVPPPGASVSMPLASTASNSAPPATIGYAPPAQAPLLPTARLPPFPRPTAESVALSTFTQEMPSLSRNAIESGAPSLRLYIQAGAFSMRDNAQRVRSRIARLGSVEVTTTSINGIEMYRVRLGPVENADEADRLLARVVDSGYPGARIVGD